MYVVHSNPNYHRVQLWVIDKAPRHCEFNALPLNYTLMVNNYNVDRHLSGLISRFWVGIGVIELPQYNDDTVKDVKAIGDVSKGTLSYDFKQHFHGKYGREYRITYLHYQRQLLRLEGKF